MKTPNCQPGSITTRTVSALAALICGLIYIVYSFPSPDWLDSPELITSSVRLGLYHPPGAPLAVMLGHALSLLPLGEPGYMLLFFSAIWAALSVYVISRINQHLWRHLGSPSNWHGQVLAAPAMALAIGLSPALLSQAVRTEVYTLGLFLALLVIFQTIIIFTADDKTSIDKPLDLASVLTGLGFAVHPLVALVPLPLAMISCLRTEVRTKIFKPIRIARSLLLLLAGAIPLALLGLMVHGWIDLRWGDPTSFTGWISYVTGATFSPTFSHGPTNLGSNLYNVFLLLVMGTGWPLLILGLLGAYVLVRNNALLAIGLITTILAACASLVLQRSFRLDNPDASGYALSAMVIVGFLANISLVLFAKILQVRYRRSYVLTSFFAVLISIYAVFMQAPGHDRSDCNSSETIVKDTLEALPEKAVVLAADFNLVFMMDYMTRVRQVRPDTTILYLRDLQNPHLRSWLARTNPDLEKLLPPDSHLTQENILKLAKVFSLSMDVGPHFPINESLLTIRPAGLVWRIDIHEKNRTEDPVAIQAAILGDLSLKCGGSMDARTSQVVAWHAYFQAITAQRLNMHELARYMIHIAKKASLKDQKISRALSLINR